MKNSINKLASVAFAFAMLLTLVPVGNAADNDSILITGEVTGGVALTAGNDVIIDIDAANAQPSDNTATKAGSTTTDGNELTVSNNNSAGFDVTVTLIGGDSGTTADTLGIAATATTLTGEGGTIKFLSVENAGSGETSLAGGTAVGSYTAYTPAIDVYTNDNSSDGLCTGGTISVDHELVGDSGTLPGSYIGTATYTIAIHV